MLTDPISDLLIRLKNGAQRRHESVAVPASKLKRAILEILKREGYVDGIEDDGEVGRSRCRIEGIGDGKCLADE